MIKQGSIILFSGEATPFLLHEMHNSNMGWAHVRGPNHISIVNTSLIRNKIELYTDIFLDD